ncbi:MAG: hypothetical protein KIH01_03760 [Candidatus Freyarchaeota archaeon]|nr:hypothetical protein [Candidatus Jordarchaeia archaeon]
MGMVWLRVVRRPRLLDPRHFLQYCFRTEEQVQQARKILKEIAASGEVPDSEWRRFLVSSPGLYTKVMRALREFGLVEKREGRFALSKEFSASLRRFADYWEAVYESVKRGEPVDF